MFATHGKIAKTGLPFRWSGFITALCFAGCVQFVAAVGIDAILRGFGIALHPWCDAACSVAVAATASFFVARLFWRLGLVTLGQYMVGAFCLICPITVVLFLMLYMQDRALFQAAALDPDVAWHQAIGLSAYVRLIRATVLAPVFLAAFYWFYHVALGMAPRTR